ncbi:MAG TPA: methionyl-tRNA formyltransferase [Oleiagrimonas sp.]|nr:methionyl-tRNA formyltransferase [Oleiagrimonas sp.]
MPASLRVVFAGTPEFAVPCLQACREVDGVKLAAVYTQPDRPAGRGRRLEASPVKQAALAAGIAVEQPKTLKDADAQARLAALAPDLMIVVAYGLILPQAVLDMPHLGCWNVHASLLPRWRGAAPIQRAIAAGDAETGVNLMRMEAGLDTGPVLLERRTPIAADDTGGRLHDRLAALGAEVLHEGLQRILRSEELAATAQADTGIAYAHKLDKAEAALDLAAPASQLERTIRAFNPWPVATLELAGERVRIWQATAVERAAEAVPGQILAANREGIDIACGEGALRLTELQRPGKRRIPVADYLNARPGLLSEAAAAKG